MNVDLFVGTLTRYYSQQWQNARTRAGAASPFGPQNRRAQIVSDPVELQGVLAQWLETASSKLGQHLKEPLSWTEGMLPPWYVGELGVAGYGGVILTAAYSSNTHLPRPVAFTKNWADDPAVAACMNTQKKEPLWEILNCGLWFPVNFSFGIGMKDPSGAPVKCGSIDLLWRALEYLNEANWGAGPEALAQWRASPPQETGTFETQAQFGFAVFHEMCRLARDHRLPMKLHY